MTLMVRALSCAAVNVASASARLGCNMPPALRATNRVEAIWVLSSPTAAFGTAGTPVNDGEASNAPPTPVTSAAVRETAPVRVLNERTAAAFAACTNAVVAICVVLVFAAIGVLVAPVVEELFFRGVLLRSFRSRWAPAPAIAAQAVVFGMYHISLAYGWGNVGLVLSISALGAVFGVAAHQIRRLAPGMIAHAIVNTVAFITILVSSHDLNHVTDVCSRILLMEAGKIIRDLHTGQDTLQELEDYFKI